MVAASVAQRYERLAMPTINTKTQIRCDELLITIAAATARISTAESTGRDWLSGGIFPIPTVRINGKRLVPVRLLEQYVEDLIEEALNEDPVTWARFIRKRKAWEGIDNSNLSK